jgi:hypothetical protein
VGGSGARPAEAVWPEAEERRANSLPPAELRSLPPDTPTNALTANAPNGKVWGGRLVFPVGGKNPCLV